MSDTSNQIIQTLEALHEDIKSAKEALKENNVVLDSNTTSTLTAEINKIPTAIKESSVLEGFNNGKNTLKGGFIYNTDATTLNNATAVLLSANEYKFPEGKTVEIDFPSVEVAYNVWNEKNSTFNIKTTGTISDLYNSILKPIYKTFISKRILDRKIDNQYRIKIYLDKSNLDENNALVANEFVFPNVNTDFYYKEDDVDIRVDKYKLNKFHFSLNYKGKHEEITCNELVVDLDTIHSLGEIMSHNGYEVIDINEYSTFRNDSDAHIINLPVFNVSYSGITAQYNGLYSNTYLDLSTSMLQKITNVQIRTEDSAENIARIHQDKHLATILNILEIFNTDGTKKYDAKTKTFVDKDTYLDNSEYFNMLKDRNGYLSDRNLMGLLYPFNPVNAKEFIDKQKDEKKQALAKLTIKPGYAYFSGISNPIPKDLFRFDDYNQPAVFEEFPLLSVDEDVVIFNRNSSAEGSGKIIGSNEVKFTLYDILDNSLKNVLPLISLCAASPYVSGVTFNGLTIQNSYNDRIKERNGITYNILTGMARLLFAPHNTKFKDTSGNDIINVECYYAPLAYNSTIKRVNIKSDSDYKGELQVLLNHGLVYQTVDPVYDKPEVPSTPMKYIIDKDTSIVESDSKTYRKTSNNYLFHLGPASTDEMTKYYDKYVHVLCPEDHPKLGTYEFCKFRLPLYNLDETKKYNYSKKVWEPVGSTTDDSLALETIYPTEYAEESGRRTIILYSNPGFELNAI